MNINPNFFMHYENPEIFQMTSHYSSLILLNCQTETAVLYQVCPLNLDCTAFDLNASN